MPVSQDGQALIVYITKSGKKYHEDGCRYLKSSKIETTLEDVGKRGLTACKVCKPEE
jgi:hypothetical protein